MEGQTRFTGFSRNTWNDRAVPLVGSDVMYTKGVISPVKSRPGLKFTEFQNINNSMS